MKKTIITSLLIFCGIILFQTSCNNEEDKLDTPDEPEVVETVLLNANKTSVTPYELITLTSTNYIFTKDLYSATIASTIIDIVKGEGNELTFMMPNLPAGTQTLNILFDDKEGKLNFTIISLPVIINPITVIENYKINLDNAIDTLRFLNSQSDHISDQNIQIFESYISDFEQALTTATEEEKQELAQFMQVHQTLFDFSNFYIWESSDSLYVGKSSIELDKLFSVDQKVFVSQVIFTGITIAVVKGSLLTGNAITGLISASALFFQFYMVLDKAEIVISSSYKPFVIGISDYLDSKGKIIFKNDVDTTIQFEASYRTLYKNDIGQGTSSIVDDLSDGMNNFLGYWNTAKSIIPGIEGTTPTLDTKTTYTENPKKFPISLEYVILKNITNSKVIASSPVIVDNGLLISFTTDEVQNQDFEFDIVYTNPDFSTETTTISATLVVDPNIYNIQIIDGNNQTSEIETELSTPLKVKVTNPAGEHVKDQILTFSVTGGGGALGETIVVTDAEGIAETTWTLGSEEGTQTVKCTGTNYDGSNLINAPLTFHANAMPISIAHSMEIISGNNQTAIVSEQLTNPLKVQVKDIDGNPCVGHSVYFHVTNGEGTLTDYNLDTDENGYVETYWTLGSIEGTQTIDCYSFKEGTTDYLVNAPLVFSATAEPNDSYRKVEIVSGNNQSGFFGDQLLEPLKVRLVDATGNPFPGEINFSVYSGGGSVSNEYVQTDANGNAETNWTLGGEGDQYVLAISWNSDGTYYEEAHQFFYSNAKIKEPYNIEIISGNNQIGSANQRLTEPLKVLVTDVFGNPYEGCTVYFDVSVGNGTITNNSAVTNASGYAQVEWTMGTTEGTNSVICYAYKSDGITYVENAPLTFNSSLTVPVITLERVSSYYQVGIGNTALENPLIVKATDQFGNLVQGVQVHWDVETGTGTISQSTITNANGIAEATWSIDNECYPVAFEIGGQNAFAYLKDDNGETIVDSEVYFKANKGSILLKIEPYSDNPSGSVTLSLENGFSYSISLNSVPEDNSFIEVPISFDDIVNTDYPGTITINSENVVFITIVCDCTAFAIYPYGANEHVLSYSYNPYTDEPTDFMFWSGSRLK